MTRVTSVPRRSSLGARLDHLLSSRFLPAHWAKRIWVAAQLPLPLARCVRNLAPDTEWRAYTDDIRVFFAIGRWHSDGSQDDSCTAIDAYFLDASAAVYSAGTWAYTREQGWWLDAVLPASYDAQHGWWLEAVMAATAARHVARIGNALAPRFDAATQVARSYGDDRSAVTPSRRVARGRKAALRLGGPRS